MTDDLEAARQNRERIENARKKEKQDIVEAYRRGDKTQAICTRFNIKPGQLYPILHQAGVKFRSLEPTHPASSLTTREQTPTNPGKQEEIARRVTVKPEVLQERKKEMAENSDTDVLTTNKKELEDKITGVQNTVDALLNGYVMDEELKVDIVETFMIAAKQIPQRWSDRETAKRILHAIQNIEGI